MLSLYGKGFVGIKYFRPEPYLHFYGKEPYTCIKDGECLILSI